MTAPCVDSDLELAAWRCGNCGERSRLLGLVTELGAVSVRHRARYGCSKVLALVIDCLARRIVTHCENCHGWRALTYDTTTHEFTEAAWLGPIPAGGCRLGRPPHLYQVRPGIQPAAADAGRLEA